MNDMTNVEPAASDVTSRSVDSTASRERDMLTPSDDTTAGCFASNPAAASRSSQASPRSKSTGTRRKNDGTP